MIPARVPGVVRLEVDRLSETLVSSTRLGVSGAGMQTIRDVSDHRVASLTLQRWEREHGDGAYMTMLRQQVRALDVVYDLDNTGKDGREEIRMIFQAIEDRRDVPDTIVCPTFWLLMNDSEPSVRLTFMVLCAPGGRRALIGAMTREKVRQMKSAERVV